jgi:hypothetical protein
VSGNLLREVNPPLVPSLSQDSKKVFHHLVGRGAIHRARWIIDRIGQYKRLDDNPPAQL